LCLLALNGVVARTTAADDVRRIISLAPSVTETIFALGAGDQLVGVSAHCNYPPQVRAIARVGTFVTPNIERILATHPDVVIAVPSPGNQRPVEALRDLGLRVVVVDAHSVAELEAAIVTIGETVGRAAEAQALVARIEARFDTVRAHVADAPPRRVLLLVGHSPLIAAGAGTLQDELIRRGGGVNLAAGAGRGWPHLSLEFVIAAAPDVIIDTGMEDGGGSDTFWRAFPSLPAVRDGRVSGFAGDALLRPGPRIGEAAEALARRIHPERFDHTMPAPPGALGTRPLTLSPSKGERTNLTEIRPGPARAEPVEARALSNSTLLTTRRIP
jgi:iron complex transport system substrate-binding protein